MKTIQANTKTQAFKSLKEMFRRHKIHANFSLEKMMDTILQEIGEKEYPQYIGEGAYARVFWLKGNRKRVLKITTDPLDAYASEIIRRNPNECFVKVYKAFEIIPKKLFALVNEKLNPLSGHDEQRWFSWQFLLGHYYDLEAELLEYGSKGLTEDFLVRLEERYEKDLDIEKEEAEEEGLTHGYDYESFLPLWPDEDTMETLNTWAVELDERKIGCGDIRPANVMCRRHTYVLADFGNGSVPKKKLQTLPIKS